MQINIQEGIPFHCLPVLERILIMGIRANTGTVDIEVNDNGDKISFSISDNNFLKQLSDFFEWFFGAKDEVEKLESKKESDANELEDFKLLVAAQEELSRQTMNKFDELFGENTCRKIFGEISPTFVCVVDVILQLADEIERIAKEHNQYFTNRYSRSRKGARS